MIRRTIEKPNHVQVQGQMIRDTEAVTIKSIKSAHNKTYSSAVRQSIRNTSGIIKQPPPLPPQEVVSATEHSGISDKSDGFKTVERRKKGTRSVIYRKAVVSDSNLIKAVPRKSYVYVGYLVPGTESETIVRFLKEKFPSKEFSVEQLSSRGKFKDHIF